ncbi:MAG: lytic transglycosylase domain-containing protein, partial [Eubacteriales bacterium]|nr:lytic transglycosylase domain-containing protein [Eubacteriales bacterium]
NSRNHSYPGSAPAALEAKARYNSYPGSTSASEVNNRYPPNTFAPQANAQPSGYPADAPSPYAPQANPSSANPSYPPPRPQEPRRRRAAPPMQPPVPPDPYEEDAIPEDDDPRNPYVVRTEKRPGRWNDEETQDAPEEITPKKPWLMIAVFAALALAVACWLLQQGFDRETDKVISARAETEQALAEKHPLRYRELIETQSQVNNLNPAFVAAIVLNESSFNSDAESSVGARGLMQLTETTAGWVAPKLGLTDAYSFDNMYHPEDNVRFGCWYLAFLAGRFRDDPILVAAAFHAGQNEVQNWLNDSHYSADGKSITLENMIDGPTKSYVKRVLNDYAAYKRLYYAQTET